MRGESDRCGGLGLFFRAIRMRPPLVGTMIGVLEGRFHPHGEGSLDPFGNGALRVIFTARIRRGLAGRNLLEPVIAVCRPGFEMAPGFGARADQGGRSRQSSSIPRAFQRNHRRRPSDGGGAWLFEWGGLEAFRPTSRLSFVRATGPGRRWQVFFRAIRTFSPPRAAAHITGEMVYPDRPPPPPEDVLWAPWARSIRRAQAPRFLCLWPLSGGSVKALPAVFSGALLAVFK